jgi:aryl-alcohol dehydrogenase-like predicted oxidoreductase
MLECEASLRRLNTDYIDLYQFHRPDPFTPVEESLMAMDDLIRAGKVRYVGISTYPAWQTVEAMWAADRRSLASAPVCEQPPYNILERRIEREVVPVAQKYGIGLIPWSPLAGGLLTGKYADGQLPEGSRYSARLAEAGADAEALRRALDISGQLAGIATEAGLTLTQLALAWCMQQPGVTSPIIGPRDRAQLRENLAALDVKLDSSTLEAIDRVAPPGEAVHPLF